jgi:type I restriction enzyme S subunit
MANLNTGILSALPVLLPPIAEQRSIARVLGALDDLIETDRSTQQAVLDLARAIYRQAVSDSGEGIPLREVGAWFSGGTPSTSNSAYWGGSVPWISAASLRSFFVHQSERAVTMEGVQNGTRVVPEGSILFVVRGMSLKTEFRVGVAQRSVAFGQDCKAIVVHEGLPRATVAVALLNRSQDVLQLVDEASHGTGRLQTDRVEDLAIQLPAPARVPVVEAALSSLLSIGADAASSVAALSRARDELLPLLLSGRASVREVAT